MSERTPERPLGLRRAGGGVLPDLRIVPREAVTLHEEADPARVAALADRLRADGALRNPPVAAALPEGTYVVLDGANRTSALAVREIPVVPLQVVEYDDPAIRLEVWRHLIVEPLDLPAALRAAGVPLAPTTRAAAAQALDHHAIAGYVVTGEAAFAVPLSPDRELAALLRQVVGTYRGVARIYRVPTEDLEALAREYGRVQAVVVFPRLEKADILTIAAGSAKLPAGITRHIIPGRALRLNLPLEALRAPGDAAGKHRWLQDLIQSRLREHRVRSYPEGVVLFDE